MRESPIPARCLRRESLPVRTQRQFVHRVASQYARVSVHCFAPLWNSPSRSFQRSGRKVCLRSPESSVVRSLRLRSHKRTSPTQSRSTRSIETPCAALAEQRLPRTQRRRIGIHSTRQRPSTTPWLAHSDARTLLHPTDCALRRHTGNADSRCIPRLEEPSPSRTSAPPSNAPGPSRLRRSKEREYGGAAPWR